MTTEFVVQRGCDSVMGFPRMRSNPETQHSSHLNSTQMTSNWEVQVPQQEHQDFVKLRSSYLHHLAEKNFESENLVEFLNPNQLSLLEGQNPWEVDPLNFQPKL